ncbi:MAG: OmpA family protein [Trichodesmium sp. MAG_R04]|nr:OmpA family protein [Trichodesmium sp. MAG_R04]
MSVEKKIDGQQVLGPRILAGCMGFLIIGAWAFAHPNAFERPTIDVQLTENLDSQIEEIPVTEVVETEVATTTTVETEDTETTVNSTTTDKQSEVNIETTNSIEQPTTGTTETTTSIEQPTISTTETTTSIEQPTTGATEITTDTLESTATSQPKLETAIAKIDTATTSELQGQYLTEPKTLGQIKFDINEVELSSPAKQTINSFISEIKEYDPNKVAIKVEGHTSRVGDAQLNQTISQDRANVVVKYLKGQNLPYKMLGQGVGYPQPLPDSDPASDINQRTVIILMPAN